MRAGQIVRVRSSGEIGQVEGQIGDTGVYVIDVIFSPMPEELPKIQTGFFERNSYVRATEANLMAISHVDQVEDRRQILMNAELIVLRSVAIKVGEVVIAKLPTGYVVKWNATPQREESTWECRDITSQQFRSIVMGLLKLKVHAWRPQGSTPYRLWNEKLKLAGSTVTVSAQSGCLPIKLDDDGILQQINHLIEPLLAR